MSKPQRLGEILPSVMQSIQERMETKLEPNLFVDEHRAGVMAAVEGFMSSKKRPHRKRRVAVL